MVGRWSVGGRQVYSIVLLGTSRSAQEKEFWFECVKYWETRNAPELSIKHFKRM